MGETDGPDAARSRNEPTELRLDPATGDWVIIAPERAARPDAVRGRPWRDEGVCFFCPGHEDQTPEELWRVDAANGDWRVRVIRNLFPILSGDAPARRRAALGFTAMPGVGKHEVVIETRDHSGDLAHADPAAARAVFEAYRARYCALRSSGAAAIWLFRNHGPAAGASLAHPHSQIIASPLVPPQIRRRLAIARRHRAQSGRNLYRDIVERELGDGRRVVLVSDGLVAFQPFAAGSPFETWIVPRSSAPEFGDASDALLDDLARMLPTVLAGLSRALGDPAYNYVIHSAPPGGAPSDNFVWHIQIQPRLTTPGGFELGSGILVNTARPEDSAAALRRALGVAGG